MGREMICSQLKNPGRFPNLKVTESSGYGKDFHAEDAKANNRKGRYS